MFILHLKLEFGLKLKQKYSMWLSEQSPKFYFRLQLDFVLGSGLIFLEILAIFSAIKL